jgi:hypothetical protein
MTKTSDSLEALLHQYLKAIQLLSCLPLLVAKVNYAL